MAITINGARFLAYCISKGLTLGQTIVVGRQGLFAPPSLIRPIFARYSIPVTPATEAFFREDSATWADDLFMGLGASQLEYLDVSAYEGASRIHDLNRPVPADWQEITDTFVDSGSLEHVFDVKTAIENYLRMVRIGGTVLLLDMPAVNFCGHGFYQFSPEFFCEVFSKRHGFELQCLALAPDWGYSPFHTVAHPRDVGVRVEIPSSEPYHLYVRALKVAPFNGFVQSVTQSDYESAWKGQDASNSRPPRSRVLDGIRAAWRRIDLGGYWRYSTRRNRLRGFSANAINKGRFVVPLDI